MTADEIAKSLIRESMLIRKRFYKNMPSMDTWNDLNDELRAISGTELKGKKDAQKKMLSIIASRPEYQNVRFQCWFEDIDDVKKYLIKNHETEEIYGFSSKNIPISSFFHSENAVYFLDEIKRRNKQEEMGNFYLAPTKILLVNYSVCPKCAHVFSFKDLSLYYIKQKPDPAYKGAMDQQRHDTRMFCQNCRSYFLPSLLVIDDVPKNEFQFLSRIQTMNIIEDFYEKKGVCVLSRDTKNLVRTDGFRMRCLSEDKEDLKMNFLADMFISVPSSDYDNHNKKILKGIKNDILLRELEERPTLLANLLQYTPTNLIPTLINGANFVKNDMLFGVWQ